MRQHSLRRLVVGLIFVAALAIGLIFTQFNAPLNANLNPYAELIGKGLWNGELLCWDTLVVGFNYLDNSSSTHMTMKEVCYALIYSNKRPKESS